MGWQTDDGEHEGWEAGVYPGGRVSTGSGGDGAGGIGAMVRPVGPDGRVRYDGDAAFVDGRQVLGWRAICTCGWHGPLWERVDDPAGHDLAARRVHHPAFTVGGGTRDHRVFGSPPDEVEDALHDEWIEHVRPHQRLTEVADAADAVTDATERLTRAVHAARDAGASWTDIGRAVGITRQSAHERWGGPR